MSEKITPIDTPRHRMVDPAGRNAPTLDRRAAYRELYQPATPVEEAIIETLIVIQDRRHELMFGRTLHPEEFLLNDVYYDLMKYLRRFGRLPGRPDPYNPRKAA